MRRNISILLAIALFISCLTGCGGQYDTGSGNEGEGTSGAAASVSGEAVSGSSVSGDMKEYSTSEENFCYHTDTNLYLDKISDVAQFRMDGTHRKKIKIQDFDELISVDENYMYYKISQYDKTGYEVILCQICRAPIEKDGEGYDVVKVERAEVLVSDCMEIWGVYADSQYVFYQRGDTGVVGKYDIENQRELPVDHVPVDKMGDEIEFMRCGDRMLVISSKGLFINELDQIEWNKISGVEAHGFWERNNLNQDAFFYYDYEDIRKADYETREDKVFITKKQIKAAARKAEGLDVEKDQIDICYVENLFCQGERLYFQIQLNWKSGDEYFMKYVIFSQGQEETELRYEKALTECMRSNGKNKKGKWKSWATEEKEPKIWVAEENVTWNAAKCYRMINGKAFYCIFDKQKEKWRVGCCELSTGKFRWLSERDMEYYEPCYGGHAGSQEMGDYYKPAKAYDFTHVYWGPDGVTYKRGGFYEDKN